MDLQTVKVVVFVPETHADIIRKSIGDAGAGLLGEYSHCSFSIKGIGRFKPLEGSSPAIGSVGNLEAVNEERIEMLCDSSKIHDIISAVTKVHPYEKVPIEIYPLLSMSQAT